MNILRVSTFPTLQKSGMGLHPYNLCGTKDDYTYFLTPKDAEIRADIPPFTEIIEKEFLIEERPRARNKLIQLCFLFRRLFSISKFSVSGIYLLCSKKIDVVHIHSPMYSVIAFVGWLLRKKIYITFHGTDFHRIKNSFLYRQFYFLYDKVFAISPDMLSYLQEIHGISKVVQIENGIDKSVYTNKLNKRKKQILAVGSLKEEKGFEVLIEAFAKFNIAHSDYSLIIAGEGILRSKLQNMINEMELCDKIQLIGHQAQREIVQLYNESQVFVLSSISEGFPKVLLEAISCGCQVVSTNVGSVGQILGDYQFIVNPGCSEDLAVALAKIIRYEFSEMEKSYSKILSNYSWEGVRNKYIEIIKECDD